MDRRSTNETVGYTHWAGDLTAHVGSSHGVRLSGGSSGGIVESVGDDTNVSLFIRPQGAAGIRMGVNSTSNFVLMQRYLVQWTVPAMSSGSTAAETTVAVTGLTTNSLLFASPRVQVNSSVIGITLHPRCSTANELVLQQSKIGESSISGTTQSAYLFQLGF